MYKCLICYKDFKQKSNLNYHNNKKNKCIKTLKNNPEIIPNNPEIIPNNPEKNIFSCDICNINFKYKTNLIRHKKKICKIEQNTNNINSCINCNLLKEENIKLKEENIKLKEENIKLENNLKQKEEILQLKINNKTNIKNSNNKTTVINNITLNSFGNENIDKIKNNTKLLNEYINNLCNYDSTILSSIEPVGLKIYSKEYILMLTAPGANNNEN